MRTVQMIGVPQEPIGDDVDAVVIALKSRTTPAQDAVTESLAALRWLQQAGCRQFYFKYCSTFDSTEKGNIGPVAEALMAHFHEAAPAAKLARITAQDSFIATGPAYAVTMPSSADIIAAAKGMVA